MLFRMIYFFYLVLLFTVFSFAQADLKDTNLIKPEIQDDLTALALESLEEVVEIEVDESPKLETSLSKKNVSLETVNLNEFMVLESDEAISESAEESGFMRLGEDVEQLLKD